MKKVLFFAAILGGVLTGCTKNEVKAPDNNLGNELIFSAPVVNKATTKTLIETESYPTTENFDVWAVYSKDALSSITGLQTTANYTSYLTAAEQHHNGETPGSWVSATATKNFWPKAGGYLTFWAASPASFDPTVTWNNSSDKPEMTKTGVNIADGDITTDYLFSDITGDQYESNFYGSITEPDDDNNSSHPFNEYKGVNILFHHALSLIEFRIGKSSTSFNPSSVEKIYINSITVKAVDGSMKPLYGSGNLSIIPTSFLGAAPSYTSSFVAGDDKVVWTGTGSTVTYTPVDSATEVSETAADPSGLSSIFGSRQIVIPQTTQGIVRIEIKYQSKINDSYMSNEVTKNIDLTASQHGGKWEWGKKYVYRILFTENEIIFDPDVVNWVETATDISI